MGRFVTPSEYLTVHEKCGKEKLYFNVEKGVGWCHSCQETIFEIGDIEGLPQIVHGREVYHSVDEKYPFAWWNARSKNYLESRWIGEEDSYICEIRYNHDRDCLAFPLRPLLDTHPILPILRGIGPSRGWYLPAGMEKQMYAYGHEFLGEGVNRPILVEGIFDVLSPGWRGYAIALLGLQMSEVFLCWLHREMLAGRFEGVYLWLDPDSAGTAAQKKLAKDLEYNGIPVLQCHEEIEPGDMGPKHPLAVKMRLSAKES